jgi:sulfite reductase (NADPH) flavoprotein alpha-component
MTGSAGFTSSSSMLAHVHEIVAAQHVLLQPESSEHVALPANPATPVIMLGAGADSIEPFRRFLQRRKAAGATGENWLLVGDQKGRPSTGCIDDRDAIVELLADGTLTRLDAGLPFAPSEAADLEQRMFENARGLWAWIDLGACVYISGDPDQMLEVQRTLTQVIAEQGRMSDEHAAAFVAAMAVGCRRPRHLN